jgi:hypothetical protein
MVMNMAKKIKEKTETKNFLITPIPQLSPAILKV